MARECKHYCKESSYPYGKILPYNQVFSQKRLAYNKASWCKSCEVSVKPPSVDKIVVTTKGHREEFPDKIKVTCPCCGSVCRGGPLSKTDVNKAKAKRKVQLTIVKVGNKIKPVDKQVKWVKKPEKLIQKSYKELGLSKTPTRGTPESKKQVNKWLAKFDSDIYGYDYKLGVLKQYNDTQFAMSNYSDWPYDTNLDEFITLLDQLNNDKVRQGYKTKFCKILNAFAKKHKLEITNETKRETSDAT